jgi:hypothetical protein
MIITHQQIAAALYYAIRQDRKNRYRLTRDWTLPKLDIAVPDFENKLLRIQDSTITVKLYADGFQSDGCTLSPDEIGSWKTVIGALFHDPWYASVDEIAEAWGWTPAAVRKLGDELFACIIVATGTPRWIARIYLTGLRAFGGIVRWASGLFGCVTVALLMSGCSGCTIPNHFEDQPVTPPQFEEATDVGK